jgi:hypothetical protein
MSESDAALVNAAAAGVMAVAAVLSLAVAIAAVVVANRSKRVAEEAVEVAEASVETSRQSVGVAERSAATARRQMALAAVPNLVAQPPQLFADGKGAVVKVTNVGPLPALGVMAIVEPAEERFVPIPERRATSSRRPHLAPGADLGLKVVFGDPSLASEAPGPRWYTPFAVVKVDYYGPQGAHVVYWYDYKTDVRSRVWRIRRLVIDPRDGGEPIVVEMSLGLDDGEAGA